MHRLFDHALAPETKNSGHYKLLILETTAVRLANEPCSTIPGEEHGVPMAAVTMPMMVTAEPSAETSWSSLREGNHMM